MGYSGGTGVILLLRCALTCFRSASNSSMAMWSARPVTVPCTLAPPSTSTSITSPVAVSTNGVLARTSELDPSQTSCSPTGQVVCTTSCREAKSNCAGWQLLLRLNGEVARHLSSSVEHTALLTQEHASRLHQGNQWQAILICYLSRASSLVIVFSVHA